MRLAGESLSDYGKRWRKENRASINARKLRDYHANPEPDKVRKRDWYTVNKEREKFRKILQKYGLTRDQYEALITKQHGRCAICDRCEVLVVDHDHASLKVRGLLCHSCNKFVGVFEKQSVPLDRMLQYLKGDSNGLL